LNKLEVSASLATELNDPFELSPNIDPGQFDQRHIEAVLRQDHHIEDAYHTEGYQRGFTSKKDFKRWYLKDVPRRAAEQLPKIARNVESWKHEFARSFDNYWRIVCASFVYDSILMWSHYADDHRGLVLAFDTTQVPFCQIPEDCWLTVNYSNKKPYYLYSHKQAEFRRKMFAVAASKASLGPMRGNSELSYLTLRFATVTFYPWLLKALPQFIAVVGSHERIRLLSSWRRELHI